MARFNGGGQKKERRNRILMGAVVIVIMVSSALAILNSNTDNASGNPVDYHGFRFSQQGDTWVVKAGKQQLVFNYHPLELEHINVSSDIISAINNSNSLLITNNPLSVNRDYIAAAELQFSNYSRILFGKSVVNGFTINVTPEVPVITCANASMQNLVIYFTDSNQTAVSMENGCIKLQAQYNTDYLRLVDRIQYSLLGIMG